jgi:hypothetical protein
MILNDVKVMILDETTVDYFSHFLKQAEGKTTNPTLRGEPAR